MPWNPFWRIKKGKIHSLIPLGSMIKNSEKKEIYRNLGLEHFNVHLPITSQKQMDKIRGQKNRFPGFIPKKMD